MYTSPDAELATTPLADGSFFVAFSYRVRGLRDPHTALRFLRIRLAP